MRIIRNAMRITAASEAPAISRPFGVMFWMSVRAWAMGQLHLCVEDFLVGLDGLVADLRGELHRELGALDLHHDGARVGRRAVDERLRGAGRLGLRLAEVRDGVR